MSKNLNTNAEEFKMDECIQFNEVNQQNSQQQEQESSSSESVYYFDSEDDENSYQPHPSRFEEYDSINEKKFVNKEGIEFELDEIGGWYDEFENYYDNTNISMKSPIDIKVTPEQLENYKKEIQSLQEQLQNFKNSTNVNIHFDNMPIGAKQKDIIEFFTDDKNQKSQILKVLFEVTQYKHSDATEKTGSGFIQVKNENAEVFLKKHGQIIRLFNKKPHQVFIVGVDNYQQYPKVWRSKDYELDEDRKQDETIFNPQKDQYDEYVEWDDGNGFTDKNGVDVKYEICNDKKCWVDQFDNFYNESGDPAEPEQINKELEMEIKKDKEEIQKDIQEFLEIIKENGNYFIYFKNIPVWATAQDVKNFFFKETPQKANDLCQILKFEYNKKTQLKSGYGCFKTSKEGAIIAINMHKQIFFRQEKKIARIIFIDDVQPDINKQIIKKINNNEIYYQNFDPDQSIDYSPDEERFIDFYIFEDNSGFRLPEGEIFLFTKHNGFYDEFDNYYNQDGKVDSPPDSEEDNDQDDELLNEYEDNYTAPVKVSNTQQSINEEQKKQKIQQLLNQLKQFPQDSIVRLHFKNNPIWSCKADLIQHFNNYSKESNFVIDIFFEMDQQEYSTGQGYVLVKSENAYKIINSYGSKLKVHGKRRYPIIIDYIDQKQNLEKQENKQNIQEIVYIEIVSQQEQKRIEEKQVENKQIQNLENIIAEFSDGDILQFKIQVNGLSKVNNFLKKHNIQSTLVKVKFEDKGWDDIKPGTIEFTKQQINTIIKNLNHQYSDLTDLKFEFSKLISKYQIKQVK